MGALMPSSLVHQEPVVDFLTAFEMSPQLIQQSSVSLTGFECSQNLALLLLLEQASRQDIAPVNFPTSPLALDGINWYAEFR